MTAAAPPPPSRPALRRQTIADALHRTALRLPAKTAITCGSTELDLRTGSTPWWTRAGRWPEFDRRGARATRSAVLARNSHGFAALRFRAGPDAGAVPWCRSNFMLKAEEVAYILRHARRPHARHRQRPGRAGARGLGAGDAGPSSFIWLAQRRPERSRRRNMQPLRRPRRLHRPAAPPWAPRATIWRRSSYTSGHRVHAQGRHAHARRRALAVCQFASSTPESRRRPTAPCTPLPL